MLAEPATRDNESVVQGDESALAGPVLAKGGFVGGANELRPEGVDSLREALDGRVRDGVQERRVLNEVVEGDGYELKTLAAEVVVDEVFELAIGSFVVLVDSLERRENLLGGLGRGLVGEGFVVGVEGGKVDGLEELIRGR